MDAKKIATRESMYVLPRAITSFIILLLSLICLILSLPSVSFGSSSYEREYKNARKEYHRLFKQRPESRGRWRNVAGRFFKIYRKNRSSNKAAEALFSAANLYGEIFLIVKFKGDLDDALWLYNILVNKYPKSRLADDSLYKLGRLLLANGDVKGALKRFEKIIKKYPDGDMASLAEYKSAEMRSKLAGNRNPLSSLNRGAALNESLASSAPCVIVIDPGHGGKDVGAIGKNRLFEKDLTLDIGKRLRARIRKESSCSAVMTRDRDVFVSLANRTVIANKSGATLFISIHVNANPDESPRGVETYFLGHPKTQEARAIAARENMTHIREEFSTKNAALDFILADMSNNYLINESSRLAGVVQLNLVRGMKRKYKGVKNLGVKQALFYVLNGSRIPGILTEVSFITNPAEGKRLAKPAYREVIAKSMLKGINEYFIEKSKLSMNFR